MGPENIIISAYAYFICGKDFLSINIHEWPNDLLIWSTPKHDSVI